MHANHTASARQQHCVSKYACDSDAYTFFNVLTSEHLLDKVESLLPEHRERVFPPTETLSLFLAQALSADRSCQKAVDEAAIKRLSAGLAPCSTHTGAYCRARMRLPMEMVNTLTGYVGQWVTAHAPDAWRWRGRPVRLVDGTTVVMPDTPANQAAYPQPRSQKPGLGYPLCRMVGLVCLGSGALLNAAIGRYRGKGGDEQTLARVRSSIPWSAAICCWAMRSTPRIFCCARCVNGVSMRCSNNTVRASAPPTFASVSASVCATI